MRCRLTILTALLASSLLISNKVSAQPQSHRQQGKAGTLSVIPLISLGAGVSDRVVGAAQNQSSRGVEEVKVSAGGGWAGGLSLRYSLSKYLDMEGGFTLHQSGERPSVENGNAKFKRNVFFASLAGKIDTSKRSHLYGGLGVGSYQSPKLTIDGFADVEVTYKTALGYHAFLGFQTKTLKSFSVGMEGRYYSVNYSADRMTFFGNPSSDITAPDGKSLKELDGSGVDFRFFLSWPIN